MLQKKKDIQLKEFVKKTEKLFIIGWTFKKVKNLTDLILNFLCSHSEHSFMAYSLVVDLANTK